VSDEAYLNNDELPKSIHSGGDKFGHIEVRGIDYVPDAERHGTARELFYVFMAPNILYLDIILGGALIKLGLGIWPAIAIIIAGNAYWLLIGLTSVSGSRSGTPGAVVMRAMFGIRANRINVAVSIWGIMVAYEAINLSVGALAGFALLQSLGIGLTGVWKLVIVLAISAATITVGVYGHATIVKLSGYFTIGLALSFVVLAWFVLQHVNLSYVPPATSGSAGFWVAATVGFVLIASNPLSFPPGADYTRYLPAGTSAKAIVLWTTVGAFVPAVLLSVLGALAGTAVDMADPQSSFAAILPKWFYPIFLLVIIVSSFTNNVVTAYSSGLGLQGFGIRARRAVTVSLDGIVAVSLTIYALFVSNFFDALNNFLSLSVAVLGPCVAIYAVDSLLCRYQYDGLELSDESPRSPFWYDRGFYWPGVAAEGLGIAVALLCINSPVFVGPIARALKGSDFSAIAGPAVAAGVYFVLARSARRVASQTRAANNSLAAGEFAESANPADD
jgi:NCS1 family nucleobase:cation symporter-1